MYRKIWFSSDTHYLHRNIMRFCGRNFSSIEEHDACLLNNHNSLVSNNDEYWFLGDFAYKGQPEEAVKIFKKMNFGKCYFLFGNHDKIFRQAIQKGLLNDYLNIGKLEIIGGDIAVNDHTLSVSKTIEINGQNIFISHYAHQTFPHAFRGAWMLFGHSHNNIILPYRAIDVGVDAVQKKYFPISIEEIADVMNEKKSVFSERGI